MNVIVGWVVGIIFVTAWVTTPANAVAIAGKMMGVGGTTAGAIIGGADDLIRGFNDAKDGATKPAPKPKKKSGGASSTTLQG